MVSKNRGIEKIRRFALNWKQTGGQPGGGQRDRPGLAPRSQARDHAVNICSLASRASSPGASPASHKAYWPPASLTDWISKIRRFSSSSMPFLSNWRTKALMTAASRRGSWSNHSLCSQSKAAAGSASVRVRGGRCPFGMNPGGVWRLPCGGLNSLAETGASGPPEPHSPWFL